MEHVEQQLIRRPWRGRSLQDGLLAALVAALFLWLRPLGTDAAAHVYQRYSFLRHGFALWDNLWYGGRYPLSYSLLYYPMSVVGIRLLALASLAAAAYAFSRLVGDEYGRTARWSGVSFAVIWGAFALSGAYPFMLGAAFALLSLLALQQGRRLLFGLGLLLSLAASPLAFVLLLVVLSGIWLESWLKARDWRRQLPLLAIVAVVAAVAGALFLLFPSGGRFPFPFSQLAAALLFCLLALLFSWRVPEARVLRFVVLVYLVACLASFLLPSAVGGNVTRLRFVAFPLAVLILSLRRWRPLLPALIVLALALSWNLSPLLSSYAHAAADPSQSASYWQPAVSYLKPRLTASFRVEVVDTEEHWGATYLPLHGIPLARGWFRQDDFPENAVLYHPLSRSSYLAWLRRLGVAYVVLTDAPLDYSAVHEAKLLKSGRSGLRLAFRGRHLVVYAVPHPTPIVTGPGRPRVLAQDQQSLTLLLDRPGRYRLSVRYSPYWTSSAACVAAAKDGMTVLVAPSAGRLRLTLAVSATAVLKTLDGDGTGCRVTVAHPGMR